MPSLGENPREFTVRTGAETISRFADSLARLNILQPAHWKGDALKACSIALDQYTTREQLIPLHLSFTDHAHELGEPDGYLWKNKLRNDRVGVRYTAAHEPIGAFIVHMTTVMDNGPFCEAIGPVILALEKRRPRLGQTVLDALNRGLSRSCRGLNPRNGIEWASSNYWMGEHDESDRVQEEYADLVAQWENLNPAEQRTHEKPKPEDIDIFRRHHYETAFPGWIGAGKIRPLSISSLRTTHHAPRLPSRLRPAVTATLALMQWLAHTKDTTNDIGGFELTSADMCPYLLRWTATDPLTQIWDDMMNEFSQGGEIHMDVNSVFAFHNDRTLRRALKRLRNFLEILNLTENLIRTLTSPKSLRLNQTRHRVRVQSN